MTVRHSVLIISLIAGMTLGSGAMAQQHFVCIGENQDKCPFAHDAWYGCGSSMDNIGRDMCTIHTPSGPDVRNFTYQRRQDVPGDRCGYAQFQLNCL